jgi:hypothetical protein
VSHSKSMRKTVVGLVILAFAFSTSWIPAHAAMVSTAEILKHSQRNLDSEGLHMLFDRSEVRNHLEALGVDSKEAKARVDSLTDEEVAQLATQIDQMPAGGDGLGILVGAALIAFLVLLLTDILGYTDVFPFIEKEK